MDSAVDVCERSGEEKSVYANLATVTWAAGLE